MAAIAHNNQAQIAKVDIDLTERARPEQPQPVDIGWRVSSYELRCGLGVSEQPLDTLPGELQEALLREKPSVRRSWLDNEEVNPFTGRP